MIKDSPKQYCLILYVALLLGLALSGAHAQPTFQDQLPPDVTLLQTSPINQQTNSVLPSQRQSDPLAIITTNKGQITIRLFKKHAPHTVANFVQLSKQGFYNGLTFHRVEPGFCIQGGCPNGNGSGNYIDPASNQPRFINLEISPRLRHNAAGVVAMARLGNNPHSASCQFYITLAPQPALDNKYAIFGGVIAGMEVVKRITIGDRILSVTISESQPAG